MKTLSIPLTALVLLGATLSGRLVRAEEPTKPSEAGTPLDRVAAFVDGEPILESEVRAVVDLRLVEPVGDEPPEALRRRVLDALVDDRLRAKDLGRFGDPDIPEDEVENEIDRASTKVGGRERFHEIAAVHGMDPSAVRGLFRRQLASLQAADERFGGSVFVDESEIAEFIECDPELRERLRREGFTEAPKVTPEIAAQVRSLLAERRLGVQLDTWMAELRRKARIELVE